MTEPVPRQEAECERCGMVAPGRSQWMFHQGTPAHEFYCDRCLKIMRIYAAIGFTLLGMLLVVMIAVVWWLRAPG